MMTRRTGSAAAATTPDEWLTGATVARLLRRSEAFVRHAVDDGRIPATRTASGVRLIRRTDLERVSAKLYRKDEGQP